MEYHMEYYMECGWNRDKTHLIVCDYNRITSMEFSSDSMCVFHVTLPSLKTVQD